MPIVYYIIFIEITDKFKTYVKRNKLKKIIHLVLF